MYPRAGWTLLNSTSHSEANCRSLHRDRNDTEDCFFPCSSSPHTVECGPAAIVIQSTHVKNGAKLTHLPAEGSVSTDALDCEIRGPGRTKDETRTPRAAGISHLTLTSPTSPCLQDSGRRAQFDNRSTSRPGKRRVGIYVRPCVHVQCQCACLERRPAYTPRLQPPSRADDGASLRSPTLPPAVRGSREVRRTHHPAGG